MFELPWSQLIINLADVLFGNELFGFYVWYNVKGITFLCDTDKEALIIKPLIIALLLLCSAVFAATAQTELRGAWVTAWENGFLSPEEADETIRLAKEAHLNALFIQVRKVGDAYYNSHYEPKASNITGGPDYDPLAYVIRKAHAQGIEVHAWVNTFRIWKAKDQPSDPNHVVNLHPDWLTRTSDGNINAPEGLYLDPGVPAVRDYVFNVFMDIVKKYDVDGIHFDYVRYPGAGYGYAPPAVEAFNQQTGRTGIPANNDPVWQQWRRDQVTDLVRRVYKAATALKPEIKITAATIPWGDCKGNFCDTSPFTQVYQDWRTWMQEGILDANVPMNYKNESNPKYAQQYRNWLDGFQRWQYGRQVYVGIDFAQQPDMVIRQMEACRNRGIDGMVGFQFNQSDARLKLVEALKNSIYSEQASVPGMLWKMDVARRKTRELYADAINAITMDRDIDKAISLLNDALRIDPDYVDGRFRLGMCYASKRMYSEAISEFQKVLDKNPNHPTAKQQIEMVKQEMAKAAQTASPDDMADESQHPEGS